MTYGLDKAYVLMNDIPLDSQNMWQLPQDFTGSFSSADGKTADETSALYDAQADTIYIYHPYQLMLMAMQGEDVSEQPVMSDIFVQTMYNKSECTLTIQSTFLHMKTAKTHLKICIKNDRNPLPFPLKNQLFRSRTQRRKVS